MRRALFDDLRRPPAKPRLKPNFFARAAQISMRNPGSVLLAAVFIALLMLLPIFSHFPAMNRLDFLGGGQAGKNWSKLQKDFPGIENLATLAVAHPDAAKLKQIREDVVEKLKARTDLFQEVLAPGAGDYYNTYGVYYHQPAELDARVAYALSLKPLFQAVAAAPNGNSLSTLVNEVAASIEQGRDPQGLDMLFTEAAASVQALMRGEERSVDWLKVAGLALDDNAQAGIILAWPKPGNVTAANVLIDSLAEGLRSDPSVTVIVQKAPGEPGQPPKSAAQHRTLVVIAFSLLLIFMVLFTLLGQLRLVLIVLVPPTLSILAAASFLAYSAPSDWLGFWPVLVAAAALGLVIGLRFIFASLEPLSQNRGSITSIMLAAQQQGPGLIWLALACTLPWVTWAVAGDARLVPTVMAMSIAATIAVVGTILVQPALLHVFRGHLEWQAREWLVPLHDVIFDTVMWRRLRSLLMLAAIPVIAMGLWFHPAPAQPLAMKDLSNAQVNLLMHSPEAARAAIVKLKSVPKAGAVRWLGAFLPADVEAKQFVLSQLKGAFPEILPQQASRLDDLQQQMDTLGESLTNIANAQGARPELKAAAEDLRRSLALFSNTGTERELLRFENRLFGSFNRLSKWAEAVAKLDPPEIKNLDPALRSMFQAANGDLRIEVTPQDGTTSLALARDLEQRGLAVAHPGVGSLNNSDQFWRTLAASSWVSLVVVLLSLGLAIRNLAGTLAAILVALIAIPGGVAVALAFSMQLEPDTLLFGTCGLTLLLLLILNSFIKKPVTSRRVHPAQYATEGWALALLFAAATAPAMVFDLQPWGDRAEPLLALMVMVTVVVGLFLVPLVRALRRA